jgi:hypothetical protein
MEKCNCKCTCGYCEEPDIDDEDRREPEPCDDCGKWNCACREIEECHCGAWRWSSTKKEMVLQGDCIC